MAGFTANIEVLIQAPSLFKEGGCDTSHCFTAILNLKKYHLNSMCYGSVFFLLKITTN
jgi:hypothetical protein